MFLALPDLVFRRYPVVSCLLLTENVKADRFEDAARVGLNAEKADATERYK